MQVIFFKKNNLTIVVVVLRGRAALADGCDAGPHGAAVERTLGQGGHLHALLKSDVPHVTVAKVVEQVPFLADTQWRQGLGKGCADRKLGPVKVVPLEGVIKEAALDHSLLTRQGKIRMELLHGPWRWPVPISGLGDTQTQTGTQRHTETHRNTDMTHDKEEKGEPGLCIQIILLSPFAPGYGL